MKRIKSEQIKAMIDALLESDKLVRGKEYEEYQKEIEVNMKEIISLVEPDDVEKAKDLIEEIHRLHGIECALDIETAYRIGLQDGMEIMGIGA